MKLSNRATSVWAKSSGNDEWLPLCQHMLDALHVGELLFDRWLARSVKDRWARGPLSARDLRVVVRFLCAAHDIGKAAPVFLAQHEPLAQRARDAGLPCHSMPELRDDRRELPHSLVGQHVLHEWLVSRGQARGAARRLASVVGAHHGRPASAPQLKQPGRRSLAMGAPGTGWPEVRAELLDWLSALTGLDRVLEHAPLPEVPLPMLVEMSGFVIVADWLASNTRLFPLRSRASAGDPEPDMGPRTTFAWGEIAMPPAWEPEPVSTDAGTIFRERFFPDTPAARPYPVQKAAFDTAQHDDVGMMFIETDTGAGKTEAALAAAEVLAARHGSQGILIALPTQATTNAMFSRVADWLARLPQLPPEIGTWAITLGHGKSMLNAQYAEMAKQFADFDRLHPPTELLSTVHEEAEADEVKPELCNAVVHQWFLGAKRRLLANFTVVTIDQLLMAALQRKHLMLAHVALSGKVVVIDEAHASDHHMEVFLDAVLSWLGAYRVPVIVLSATLTAARRRAMMRAYAPHRAAEVDALTFDPSDYPLVTVVPLDDGPVTAQVVPDRSRLRELTWSWHPTELDTLVASVMQSLQGQGCALVVRNTVADAQQTAAALAERGLPVKLSHAGFLAADRAANDDELQFLFGKEREGQRPDLAVVVATQVVEQSLDIDFDVLFTDIAPMDLLIQRMGRLHRHARVRPPHLAHARVHVLADTQPDGPPRPSDGSRAVYGEHLLLRTMATLASHGFDLRFPEQTSPLVSQALGVDPVGPASWQNALASARTVFDQHVHRQRTKATTWCVRPWSGSADRREHLGDWLQTTTDYTEIQMGATVRDTLPSLEVIVIPLTVDGTAAIRPPWVSSYPLSPEVIDTSTLPSDELAREIGTWTVRLPARMTYGDALAHTIEAIDTIPHTRRWLLRRHPLLKGELLLPMRQTHEGSTELTTHLKVGQRDFELHYSPDRGLEVSAP